jgi:hypothetical protein
MSIDLRQHCLARYLEGDLFGSKIRSQATYAQFAIDGSVNEDDYRKAPDLIPAIQTNFTNCHPIIALDPNSKAYYMDQATHGPNLWQGLVLFS